MRHILTLRHQDSSQVGQHGCDTSQHRQHVWAELGVISFSILSSPTFWRSSVFDPIAPLGGCIVILGRAGRDCGDVGLVLGVWIFLVFDIQFCRGFVMVLICKLPPPTQNKRAKSWIVFPVGGKFGTFSPRKHLHKCMTHISLSNSNAYTFHFLCLSSWFWFLTIDGNRCNRVVCSNARFHSFCY